MEAKLAILGALERVAGAARRAGLGRVVDRIAPLVGRRFERFELDVGCGVDVSKLDVEGGELDALRGLTRLVTGARALFLELNPELLAAAGSSSAELLAWLDEHGFAVDWIDEAKGRPAPLSEPWSETYVNLVCRRAA